MAARAQAYRGVKRPLDDRPVPSAARRRSEVPPEPLFLGQIVSYDQAKGYGFIQCDSVAEGDIYFQRGHLPPDAAAAPKGALRGYTVEFSLHLTPDGKPRADWLRLLGISRGMHNQDPPRGGGRGGGRGDFPSNAASAAPPPPLNQATIEEMTRYLEDRGGAMDFGKFTRDFRGVKKSQLEDYFRLVPDQDDARGRWQITLPDVEPLTATERRARDAMPDEPPPPREEKPLGHVMGSISLYDPSKGYGFIKSPEVLEGDVYFKRSELPPESQSLTRSQLLNMTVEFDCYLNTQGKARGEKLKLMDDIKPPDEQDNVKDNEAAHNKKEQPAPPPLDESTVSAMRDFLEAAGGAMDYGKFSNQFAGVKKVQLEGHFTLVPESGDTGGRWQITLPGVEPLSTEEREIREAREQKVPREPREFRDRPLPLEPSASLWLLGVVKKWDHRKSFGFLAAEGMQDVFLHRNDLSPEMQAYKGNLMGSQVAFELGSTPEGKLRAVTVRPLLMPDGFGGWELRRA